jgi:hypothetical protein
VSKVTADKTKATPENTPSLVLTDAWPTLPWTEWQDTVTTLQLWLQIVGKIRMALAPKTNHWWHVTLYPTSRGLTTSPMPYGQRFIQIDFDFLSHQLLFQTSEGRQENLALKPMSVAEFYSQVLGTMDGLGMPIKIRPMPEEMPDPIPFDQDYQHNAYDAVYVTRFHQVLLQTSRVFTEFRAQFLGKVSPVHFFWGAMDLAVTRFSGSLAPKHDRVPNIADHVVQSAYSHEVSSCGFWPGGPLLPEPIFYAYAFPAPIGFAEAQVRPAEAQFNPALGEFVLPYEAVRTAQNPDQTLMDFLQDTYAAAADLGHWDRQVLEVR